MVLDSGVSVVAVDEATGKVAGAFGAMDIWPKMGCCQMVSAGCSIMSMYRRNPELGTMLEIMDSIKKPIEKEYNEIRKKHKLG